jgi:hypothetical protein
MDLLPWFSSDVAGVIVSYCDLGDKGDQAIFDSLSKAREKWLLVMDFKDETFCKTNEYGEEMCCRQTSLRLNDQLRGGERVLHSIDDRPCLVISREPIKDVSLGSWEDSEMIIPSSDPLRLAAWGRFGLAHREDDYAYIQNAEDSSYLYARVWARNGTSRSSQDGHSLQWIFLSPAGFAIDCWQWRRPGELPPLKFLRRWSAVEFMASERSYAAMMSSRLHRDDGPAIVCVPRNKKEKAEQALIAEESEYDSYDGIQPRHQWYLDGFAISRGEHARITREQ